MSLHLVIEDNAPTVCPACQGDKVLLWRGVFGGHGAGVYPCPECCCSVCGDTTETAPLCKACDERQSRD
jgi:hypothetical protein